MSTESKRLREKRTDSLHSERKALLLLTRAADPHTALGEQHANLADRVSDEIDGRNDTR